MTSSTMAGPTTTQRLGNVLIVLALLLAAFSVRPTSAGALDGVIRADTPGALSVRLSEAVVSNGVAEAVIVAPDDRPADLAGIGAALGALPGEVSLLLTPAGALSAQVATEIDRIRNDRTIAYVVGSPVVAAALETRGLTVIAIGGSTPTELALALINQTHGVPAGPTQRVVVTAGDLRVAGLANAFAANLGLPVVPVAGAWEGEAILREVIAIADPAALPDGSVSTQPGNPFITRVWDADLNTLAGVLAAVLAAEPLDGDLAPRVGPATIVLDDDESDPHPALLSAVASAAYALDGLDANVRLAGRDAVPVTEGPAVRIGLNGGQTFAPPAPPLPATGGGLAGAAVLGFVGFALRRRS